MNFPEYVDFNRLFVICWILIEGSIFDETKLWVGGDFTAYMSSPCHIELILSEKEAPVKKEAEEVAAPRRKNQGRLRSGATSATA